MNIINILIKITKINRIKYKLIDYYHYYYLFNQKKINLYFIF